MPYCINCGQPVATAFCGACGTKLPTEALEVAPTTDVAVARPTARTVALPRTPKPCPSCGEGIVYPGNKCRFCGFHYVDTPAARTYAHTPGRYQTGPTRNPGQYLPAITTTVRITLLSGCPG